jgi:hypothetical protein
MQSWVPERVMCLAAGASMSMCGAAVTLDVIAKTGCVVADGQYDKQ